MGADERIIQQSEPGHDRDCALAMLSQARHRTLLDEVQVQHLIAIGWRSGHKSGYRQAITDLRDEATRSAGATAPVAVDRTPGDFKRARAYYSGLDHAADFLESRLTKEGESDGA